MVNDPFSDLPFFFFFVVKNPYDPRSQIRCLDSPKKMHPPCSVSVLESN